MDATQGNTELPELDPATAAANAAADAQDDDDFLAAFTNARSDTLGTEGSTSSATTAAPAAAAAPAPQGNSSTTDDDLEDDAGTGTAPAAGTTATPAEDDLDAPVTITKRQLEQLTSLAPMVQALQGELRKTVDSTNGRIGSIQQTLKDVSARAAAGFRPSFDQMEELEQELPEIAGILKRTLERSFGVGNATEPGSEGDPTASGEDAPGAAAAPANPLEDAEVRKVLREKELAIVDATHKGWRQLPATQEWKAWQQQLPPAAQQLLATATDAATLNDALDDFKAYQQKQAAAASASNQRDKRLANAIPATTGSAQAHRAMPNEDDEFNAGFQSVAGRR